MIRNIIFDIGKVLVSYEPDAYMDRLGLDEKAKAAINQAMFQNKLWDESDQGLGTPEELLQKFIAGAPEYAEEITKIHQTVGETVELMPYAMEWILDLKARGYHVYIISNYAENMYNQTKDKLTFLPLMDDVVMSYTTIFVMKTGWNPKRVCLLMIGRKMWMEQRQLASMEFFLKITNQQDRNWTNS